jgi:hypothetical protein
MSRSSRRIVVALVMSGCAAAPAAASPQVPPLVEGGCDANGVWVLNLKTSADDDCNPTATTQMLKVVMRANGDARLVSEASGFIDGDVRVQDVGGDCVLDLFWRENLIAAGTPDEVRYDYHLVETRGRVTGSGRFADIDDVASTDEHEVRACEVQLVITGEHRR